MNESRPVKLRIGSAEVVEIPPGFDLPYSDATLRQEGEKLIIEPSRKKASSLKDLLASWTPEDFPEIADLPLDEEPDLG